ncbi:hypothetical protein E8E12_008919 [Didymella heteroderae]|uniref:Uncharacterized protein n=1 Tax=Didymella heteroderae TaxID=1769908 RepID=A0A9P4WSU3_9PLEO|nr:hypothetical protein E8E12_008919 [Didymella heteroderae]
MNKYTCHVFRKMEAYISNTLLTYDEIDAVSRFGASHPRLFNRMVNRLVVMVREETIPDLDVFAQYCLAHPELNSSIAATMAWQPEQPEQANASAKWPLTTSSSKSLEQVHLREKNAECKKRDVDRWAEEKKHAAHDSAMRQACLAKTRATGKDRS